MNTNHSLPLPMVSAIAPKLASNLATYGLDMANVLAVASSSNLAVVAITRDFHLLDLGGLAVTIYRLITDSKFIRQVKKEFIFGSYKK